MKKKFNFKNWFELYGISLQLHRTLDKWQIAEIERTAKRAYLLGKKSSKKVSLKR